MHRSALSTVIAISKAYWQAFVGIFVIGITQTFIGNYTLVAFQRLLDGFPNASAVADLSPLLIVYIAANLLNHILIYLEGIPASTLQKGIGQWVKLHALQKLARIDYQAYQNLGTGNLVQIIENGAEAVHKIVTGFYISNLRAGLPQFLIGMYFIYHYDRGLFAVALVLYVVFILVSNTLMQILKRAVERMLSNQEDFSKFSVRAFMELVVFRVNGRFKAEIERMSGISDAIVRARVKVYLLQELAYTGFAFILFLIEVGVVIQQASKILAGTSTIGTLVALVGFVKLVFWPIIGFGQSWMEYKLNLVSFERLYRVLSLPEDAGLERGEELRIRSGEIMYDRVYFRYQAMEKHRTAEEQEEREELREVLRDFSLAIAGGKITALVGASGSGKSTLIRLLLHLLKPTGGRVLVDGQDLAKVNLLSYYQQVVYIPQEPPIFDGTLRENLTFETPVPQERLVEIIQQVGLRQFIENLPDGLETLVGERGIKLSGGERQRVAFGRLLLRDPKIVILDEPTSALDSITEEFISKNLVSFLKGKTVILVAHRLQTVSIADRIAVLEDGNIVQQGTYHELVEQPGLFRRLWEKQARESQKEQVDAA